MSIYTTAIKYEPEWEAPEDEVLNAIAVDNTLEKKVVLLHTGLKNVTMTGTYRERSGDQFSISVQKFKIKDSGMNKKPSISPEELTRLFTYVAQQHCNAAKVGEVVYRCNFYGDNDELGRSFQKNKSFRLRPVEEVEEQKTEDDEDEKTEVLGPTDRGPVRMSGRIESELVQVIRINAEQSKQLQSDVRANLKQAREDHTEAMQSIGAAWGNIVTSANTLIDKLGDEVDGSRKEASLANNRLVRMSEEHAKKQDAEKNILSYAMDMFTKAMQTQWSGLSRDMAWERQIMYQQFEALAQENKKDTRRGWVKDFSPILLAVAGQIIEKTGNKAQGKLLQEVAEAQLRDDEEEEDDDDEEEETPTRPSPPQRPRARVVDVDATPKEDPVMGVPAGAHPGKFFEENPIASRFQLFGNMIKQKEGQLKKLKSIMGTQNYRTLQQAIAATEDTAARTLGTKLLGSILLKGDMREKIDANLDKEQRELLADISKELFGGQGGFKTETVSEEPKPPPKKNVAEERKKDAS